MRTPFKMKSGNASTFKNLGSSPMKQDKMGRIKESKVAKKEEPTLLERTSVYMDNTAAAGAKGVLEDRKGHRDYGKPARSNWADIADHVNKKYPNLKSEIGDNMPKDMASGTESKMSPDEYRLKNKLPRVYDLKKHPRSGTYSEKGK